MSRRLRANLPVTRESLKPAVPDPAVVRERGADERAEPEEL